MVTDNATAELERIFGDTGIVVEAEYQAEWREEKAQEYPDDERNQETADALRGLVNWINANRTSPVLVRLNAALHRLYNTDDWIYRFDPTVTDRLGRMAFDYCTDPIRFLHWLAEDIETFLADT